MVTIENEIFTAIADRLRDEFEGIFVSGEYVMVPPSFPAVSIEEADNYTATKHYSSAGDDHAVVTYEINVYTNKTVGKRHRPRISWLLSTRN